MEKCGKTCRSSKNRREIISHKKNDTTVITMRNLFFIASPPRAGSTWLSNLLNSQPDMICRHEPLGRIHQHLPQVSFDRLKSNECLLTSEREKIFDLLCRAYPECDRPPFFRKSYSNIPPQARYFFWLLASKSDIVKQLYVKWMTPSSNKMYTLALKETGWSSHLESIVAGLNPAKCILLVRHPCAIVSSMLDGIERKLMNGPSQLFRQQWYENHRAKSYVVRNNITKEDVFAADTAIFIAMRLRVLYDIFNEILDKFGDRVLVVVYEDIQSRPVEEAGKLFQELQLEFSEQTELFIKKSTGRLTPGWLHFLLKDSKVPFYSVHRNSDFNPDKWKTKLPPNMISAIKQIVGEEHLEKFWPICS